MTDEIQIPFATNAKAAAEEIAGLRREVEATAAANARREKVIRSIISTQRAERAAIAETRREYLRLHEAESKASRRFANGGGGGFGGGGGGHGFGRPTAFGKGATLLARASMLPGVGPAAGSLAAISALGVSATTLGVAAAALLPAAIAIGRAATKTEAASIALRGAVAAQKALDGAQATGDAAHAATARGSFESNGAGLKQLLARGGNERDAKTFAHHPDAIAGLSLAMLIKDPLKRGSAIAAADGAARLGEGSFSDHIKAIVENQVGVSGESGASQANIGALIGASRGTAALPAEAVAEMQERLRVGVGGDLTRMDRARGKRNAAGIEAGLDGTAVVKSYDAEREAIEDPYAKPREAAMKVLKASIEDMKASANQQSLAAAGLQKALARFGLSLGSDMDRAERYEDAVHGVAGEF